MAEFNHTCDTKNMQSIDCQLRTDDDECLLLQIRKAINENLSEAKWEYLHTQAEVDNQFQIISYMASELNQLSSIVETDELINKENEDKLKAKSISSTRHRNWYISTLALRYLKPAFLSVVQDKVNSVHEEIFSQFGRLTCAEATAEDIESKGNMVQFKHTDCPGQVYDCQTLLNIIKSHTVKSGKSFEMLQGTDPQKWLKTPFDFACLFIPPWLRRRIEDFKGFDISALCVMVNQCKPLIEMFDEKQIAAVKTARYNTMHSPGMEITQQDMTDNIEVILDLLNHMKSLKNTDDITEAIDFINQLRAGNANFQQPQMVQLITECLPDTTRELLHKQDKNSKVKERIIYLENELARFTSESEDAESKNKERTTAIDAKLLNENNTLKDENRKLKDETRELKNQLEEMKNMMHTTPRKDPAIDDQRPFNF